jgi:hypothetical protein
MNLFEQLILEADAEAAEIEKLKKGSANASKIQEIIDKLPEGKDKQEAQKELDSAIKDLSAREQKTAPKPSAVATPPPADQAKAQQPAKGQAPQPSAVATPPQEPQVKRAENPYSTDYKGVSIVDFLAKSGQSSDLKSRQALAQKMGIADYKGTAEQNTQMLKSLQKQAQDFQKMDQAAQQSQTPAAQTASTPASPTPATTTQSQTPVTTSQPQQQVATQTPTQQPKLTPAQQSVLSKKQNNQNMNRADAATYASIPAELKPQPQVAQQAPAPKNRAEAATAMKQRNQTPTTAVAQQPKPKEKSEANEEKIKKCKDCGLNKITVQEKNNISKFLMHLSEKNYSSAHKYLKAIVNSKINKIVSERIDKI